MKMKKQLDDFPLDEYEVEKTALIVWALNHPLRQKMLMAIHEAGSIRVSDLCTALDEIQPVVSQNLGVLRRYGFVHTTKEGGSVFCSVNHQRLDEVQGIVWKLVNGHHTPQHS
jgi:DNA-binding transcriptional ArsR family regulator